MTALFALPRPIAGLAATLTLALVGATSVACQGGSDGSPSNTASDGTAIVKAAIQKANQEQQQAFTQDKPALMRSTATAAHYAELVKEDATLRSDGVNAIRLRSTTFGQVSMQADSGTATTTERWQATFSNHTIDVETSQNVYKLIQSGGAWKISGDTVSNANVPPSSNSPSPSPTPIAGAGSPRGTVGSTSRN